MKSDAMRDLFFRSDNAWLAQDCRDRLKTAVTAGLFVTAVLGGVVALVVALTG